MDLKADEATRAQLLELIENSINRKYFKESRLDAFFEKCFTLTEPHKLMEEKVFYNFVYYDLKQLLQLVTSKYHLVEFTKFMIFFKVDEDPELYELLVESICKKMKGMTVDELLTILANMTQSLSPVTEEVFQVVNEEFCVRLTNEHNPTHIDLVMQPEDLLKITTTLLEYGQMHQTLKQGVIDYIEEHLSTMTYETTSELAVIYASRMDDTYKKLFFEKTGEKFLKELRYLKDETMYKIVWAMVKAQSVLVAEESDRWNLVKTVVSERASEISPKVMSDLLVLSTMEAVASEVDNPRDLFSAVEGELMKTMKLMGLDDLINIMWTALKIDRGS